MAKLIVTGGKTLCGEVRLQTSKNATLALLAAGVLSEDKVTFLEVPDISDVNHMLCILRSMGAKTRYNGSALTVDYTQITPMVFEESCGKVRASVFLLGPLVGRFRQAELLAPGGCNIGARPLDIHAHIFQKLGCTYLQGERIRVQGEKLVGNKIRLRMPSVGATVNAVCAAVKAEGETVIENVAREPEICDLVAFLRKMGAKIQGEGTPQMIIQGVKKLHGTTYLPQRDRIEGGTFLAAMAITGGEGVILGVKPSYFSPVLEIFLKTACKIQCEDDKIYIRGKKSLAKGVSIKTGPYPGFPTDMQSVMIPVLTKCSSQSTLTETLFENRFSCALELTKMGANISVQKNVAFIRPSCLYGATVTAKDLRAAAGLAVGALAAEGESEILEMEHLLRGYENFQGKLSALGAKLEMFY
ncbi:MAG: UDP-N-acetylglucosamine 1-carboxyvinyltransferase [Clostridiales bacterium]|nr:UDP-N-acetylglucosamine 1-carboxyvinyltransferase [Clostridiales bacterium]